MDKIDKIKMIDDETLTIDFEIDCTKCCDTELGKKIRQKYKDSKAIQVRLDKAEAEKREQLKDQEE